MHYSLADYVLWLTTPLLQGGVLLAMYRRGLQKDYPYFFYYTVLQVASAIILAVLAATSYTAYYYAYYINLGLSVLISFAVLQEIFKDAFRPYENLRELSIILFRWSALVVLLVAVMWAINAKDNSDNGVFTAIMMLGDRSLRLMQCGLVFFLLLFNEYLGIPHRSMLFGISLGFGLFAAVNMLVATALTQHGFLTKVALSEINSVAYLVAVIIWFGYTLAAAPSKSKAREDLLLRTEGWDTALEEARVVQVGSVLDLMDQTVERLFNPAEDPNVKLSSPPTL
jgi:hypothetical protein